MKVVVTHTTRIDYDGNVAEGVLDARLGPRSDAHQRWDGFDLRVSPAAAVRRYSDGFGNAAHLITVARPHGFLEVITHSQVETMLADPFQPPPDPPRPLSASDRWDYLAPSRLIEHAPELERVAAPFRPADSGDTFNTVRRLMGYVYDEFTYQQNVTTVATTVREVLEGRSGVCQDFAHLLIGLCRSLQIPARYVSGYIVQAGQGQTQTLGSMRQSQSQGDGPSRGAGASHAWIEAYTPSHGWRGFDPTNNLVASQHHIKMAIGRDYNDVPPTRGTSRGEAREHLSVEVVTRVID